MSAPFTPDFIQPIVGYRFWYNFKNSAYHPDGHLHSLNDDHHQWPIDAPMIARPAYHNYRSGGIHAFKTLDRLREENAQIHGEVWLWGRIEEHEDGYRAEFAYPKKLWAGPNKLVYPIELAAIAKRYGIATEEQASWTLESILKPFMPNRLRQHRLARLNRLHSRRWSEKPPLGNTSPNTSEWGRNQEEIELMRMLNG